MESVLIFLVLASILAVSHGLVHWKLLEIEQHNTCFPSRFLEEESQTIKAARSAVESLSLSFNESLYAVVDYQRRELEVALRQAADSHDEDCVQGLSSFMSKAVESVISSYKECTEEVLPRLDHRDKTLQKNKLSYDAAYTRALDDISHCVRTYSSNQESRVLIEKCVKNHVDRYFREAFLVQWMYNIDFSPAMKVFRDPVVECVGVAFDSVVSKGAEFLRKLKCCTNSTAYENWHPVQNNLKEQIYMANQRSKSQANKVENEIKSIYTSQFLTAEKYLNCINPKEHHRDVMYSLMNNHFQAINFTEEHNPGEWQCISGAKSDMITISELGSAELSNWEITMRENTSQLLEEINLRIERLVNEMPFIGNAALLKCFSKGYIFAPNTIRDCFELTYSQFELSYSELLHFTKEDLKKLGNYLEYFQDRLKYPPVSFSVKKSFLEADEVLHELQRCLYKSSATVYPVTTPSATETQPTTSFQISIQQLRKLTLLNGEFYNKTIFN